MRAGGAGEQPERRGGPAAAGGGPAAAGGGPAARHRASLRSPDAHLADVSGLSDVKRALADRFLLPLSRPDLAGRYRVRPGGGVLLHGPPGTGKTLVARALAGEAGVPLFETRIPEIMDKYVGEAEKRLAALFREARENAPAVLFIDELDWLGADREEESGAVIRRLVPLLLSELETAAGSGVLVLAATNLPWRIDPALLRPGRFDVVLLAGLPDVAARRGILAARLADRPLSPGADLDLVAKSLSGATGAEVAEVAERAALAAFREAVESGREDEIGPAHLAAAATGLVRSVTPGALARYQMFARDRA